MTKTPMNNPSLESSSTPSQRDSIVCPVCRGLEYRIIRNRLRYGIVRDVVQCSCGFVYLWPRIGKQETVDFYQKGEFRKINRAAFGLQTHDPDGTFQSRLGQARHRFSIVKPYLDANKSFLEIGCGSGSFLSLVQPLVKKLTAMELDPIFAGYVRKKLGIEVLESAIENFPQDRGPFDVICMWFVLEHLHDPVADLKKLRDLTSPQGILLMLLPNLLDPLVTLYRSKPYEDFFYQLPHLNYFSPSSLSKIMQQCGWESEIVPIQIYGLANHVRWIFLKKPQPQQSWGTPSRFDLSDHLYRKILQTTHFTDSLLVIARKGQT